MLEAGSGEGYGADLIADVAAPVIGLDYDDSAVAHVRARYPRVDMRQGNLAELPLPDASVDVVVNFQVIEHLWDQAQFVAECSPGAAARRRAADVAPPTGSPSPPAATPRSTRSTPANSTPPS